MLFSFLSPFNIKNAKFENFSVHVDNECDFMMLFYFGAKLYAMRKVLVLNPMRFTLKNPIC